MNSLFLSLYIKFQILMDREDGQDMVEYALAVALIAFAAVAGIRTLASALGVTFSGIASMLNSAVS
jgi:pilus assembly protein Flp/PilA